MGAVECHGIEMLLIKFISAQMWLPRKSCPEEAQGQGLSAYRLSHIKKIWIKRLYNVFDYHHGIFMSTNESAVAECCRVIYHR
jgi:hypothetical protein